jgi:hypothetical protein
MRKVSKKLEQQQKEYSKLRKTWLTNHPMCQAKIYNCTLKSTDVHHKKGRGKYLLDTNTWLSVCRSCHTWIELNPEDSKDLGFSISKI